MAKRMFIFLSVIVSLMLASTSTIAAQTSAPDVPAIAKSVLSADPAALLDGLQTPMRNRALPDGFSDAEYRDITGTSTPEAGTDTSKECLYDASGLSDTEGAVGYNVVGDASVVKATYVCASINYIVFNERALGKTPLADFKSGVEQGLGDAAGEGTPDAQGGLARILDTKVAGEDAVLLTYTLDSSGTSVVVQTLAIPVGDVFVISVVTIGDSAKVDARAAKTYANELTVAAIDHLGTIADGAQ